MPNKLACFLVCAFGLHAADGKLTIYMGGKPIATETYSVAKSDGKLEVNGTGSAQLGTMKISIDKFDLIVDGQFQPVSIDAKATLNQMQMAHSVTFADGKAKDQINAGQSSRIKEDSVHADDLVVNSNLPLFAWSVLALRAKTDTADAQSFYAYILGQGEVPVTALSKGVDEVEFANKKASLNHLSITFKQSLNGEPVTAELWINDARQIVKITVPSQSVEAYQDGFDPKPPPPAPPAPEK